MPQHDFIIIGGGLGGLLCGAILAKNGINIGIVDQNKQVGGCLQSFSIQKHLFDSCVHYIGGLDNGNTLDKIFEYTEIKEQLELIAYPSDTVDKIYLGSNSKGYSIAQGYQSFIDNLVKDFPDSTDDLKKYINRIQESIHKFPMYRLLNDNSNNKLPELSIAAIDVINECIKDNTLRQVLFGNSLLYAGDANSTPFFLHALIVNSYIESSYKIKGSSVQIAKALVNTIRKYGGIIYRNEKVIAIQSDNNIIERITTHNGTQFHAQNFIAAIHPNNFYQMLNSINIKQISRKRIAQYPNSIGAFLVNIVIKPNTIPYIPYNIYWSQDAPLDIIQNNHNNWPKNYAIYSTPDMLNESFTDTISILSYMDISIFEAFETTHNTKANPNDRGAAYKALKKQYAEKLIEKATQHIPALKDNIDVYDAATPLTFKDYMGTTDGSIYGMVANFNLPLQSQIATQSKIDNLYFTGQNVNIHGVLGVSITAVSTCGTILGLDQLLQQINKTPSK